MSILCLGGGGGGERERERENCNHALSCIYQCTKWVYFKSLNWVNYACVLSFSKGGGANAPSCPPFPERNPVHPYILVYGLEVEGREPKKLPFSLLTTELNGWRLELKGVGAKSEPHFQVYLIPSTSYLLECGGISPLTKFLSTTLLYKGLIVTWKLSFI